MGSLTAGWDSARRAGCPPKGFEDYEEPRSPRAQPKSAASPFSEQRRLSGDLDAPGSPGGPPSLRRVSAPAVHGSAAVQRYLSRGSSGGSGAGGCPPSPRVSTPRSGAASHKLVLKVGDEECSGSPLSAKERWCTRVESSRLNERPDEGDQDAWRHGSFKMADEAHAMHLPSAAAAAASAPLATVVAARVTVERVPQTPSADALASLDSAGL